MDLLPLVFLGTLIALTNGALVGIADLKFNKFTTQTCPGFTVTFNTELFSPNTENGNFKMNVTIKELHGELIPTTHPCMMDKESHQGSCVFKGSLLKKNIPAVQIYFDTGKEHYIVGRIENIAITAIPQLFGPMEIHWQHVTDNNYKLRWYLPFLKKCLSFKTMHGFHFKCTSPSGDCGNYTSMSFECNTDTDILCKTLKKDRTVICKNYKYYIPLDGGQPNISDTVQYPYILCEMELPNLKKGHVYKFQGRYTFNGNFANNEPPEVFDRWSHWSNVAVIGEASPTNPTNLPQTGDGNDDNRKKPEYLLSIIFGCVLGLLLVVGVVWWIKQRFTHRSSHFVASDFKMITPRNSNTSLTT